MSYAIHRMVSSGWENPEKIAEVLRTLALDIWEFKTVNALKYIYLLF